MEEIGTLISLGPKDSCDFFHDPFLGKRYCVFVLLILFLFLLLLFIDENFCCCVVLERSFIDCLVIEDVICD